MNELIIVAVLLGVLLGVAFAVVQARTKARDAVLEPGPDAPRVPPEVKREVAEHMATLLDQPVGAPSEAELAERAEQAAAEDVLAVEAELSAAELAGRTPVADEGGPAVEEPEVEPEALTPVKPRFRDRLARARSTLAGYVGDLLGRDRIDEETWEELEEALIRADVGIEPTSALLERLRTRVRDEDLTDGEQLVEALKDELKSQLGGFDLDLVYAEQSPTVWLFVGVNGVGKTTTIGKLGKREIDGGRAVVMAAGDTFRAAAAEQLGLWADRAGADLVRGNEGGDPSAVIFDAVEAAAARGADLVLADTAGRLHTKTNLMEELRKVRRVADKGAGTVTEVLLVLDATTGQNGLVQARQFTEAADLTGVVLTKLDGSAKGGIVIAIQAELGIPVKLVGLGEGIDDLVPFDADEFVDALFS
ncbi:MAG: signal recognition particle-docking protein FtsY [Acidimicrobiales bacterium]|jgi:fused signal recognition particle receptor|nr:signal recognition particle-docking protein FtsY [Acidimicrobiales bacterium]